MNLNANFCDRNRVRRFIERDLSEPELVSFEQHLSACETCQATLSGETAEFEFWDKTSRYLRDDENELLPLTTLSTSADERFTDELIVERVLDSLAPTDDPQMLGRVGNYEISGVIGCGGMGAVLKGVDPSLNRVVAIKVMAPHLAASGAARKRFAREAQAAAAVTHNNVIEIYGVSEANGLPYLVMPCALGSSLQKRLDRTGPFSVVEVLRIGVQVATGLAAAHEQGLVHRDIKPGNILLNDGIDRLLITDFGLARAIDDASVTRTGVIAGTPQYMSPEQARGEAIDARSDLFSLGSVLYALCTGRPPFRAENTFGILRRITDQSPRPIKEIIADVPDWLCRIIDRLLAKDREDRFASAQEVASVLRQCLAHVQTPSRPLPPELCVRPASFRSGIIVAATVSVVLAVSMAALMKAPTNKSGTKSHPDVTGSPSNAATETFAASGLNENTSRLVKFLLTVRQDVTEDELDWESSDAEFTDLTETTHQLVLETQDPFSTFKKPPTQKAAE